MSTCRRVLRDRARSALFFKQSEHVFRLGLRFEIPTTRLHVEQKNMRSRSFTHAFRRLHVSQGKRRVSCARRKVLVDEPRGFLAPRCAHAQHILCTDASRFHRRDEVFIYYKFLKYGQANGVNCGDVFAQCGGDPAPAYGVSFLRARRVAAVARDVADTDAVARDVADLRETQ